MPLKAASSMDDSELSEKIERLRKTEDHAERHSLALELSEIPDVRVFDTLVALVQRPDLENWIGTLIYCLGNYDCASVTDLLVSLAEADNFEVAMGANTILREQGL